MPERDGWGFPANASKAHYFFDGVLSLCSRWMYGGELEQGNDDSPDNCAECKRKLAKRRAQSTDADKAGEGE